MKAESDPVEPDEYLIRRVHVTKFRDKKTPYVSPSAFEPRVKGKDPDVDGISLFRADCLSDPQEVLRLVQDPVKRAANGLVAIQVSEFQAMGLSIATTPRDDIAGHVSIVEMNAAAILNSDTKQQCKKWMKSLAEIASSEDRVLHDPTA